jgi:hypothetical protein
MQKLPRRALLPKRMLILDRNNDAQPKSKISVQASTTSAKAIVPIAAIGICDD